MKPPIHPRSIAFRLIVAVLAVELLSAILVVALSYGYERHVHFRAFDVMIRGHVDSIVGAIQDADDPPQNNVMLVQADLHLPPDDIYQVYDSGGRLLGRSPNWQGLPPDAPEPGHSPFQRIIINGRRYRVFRSQGTRIIDVAEPGGGKLRGFIVFYGSPTEHVWNAIHGTVEFYAAGSALLLLVTGPLIAWLLHRGLLPLRQLATLASQVSVDSWEFSPPERARRTPELAPLTHAIESVLQRLECSFVLQRTFVSDAAHELKTAVAVIKSTLQLLNMKRRSSEEYKAGLERCLADSQRMEEIVAKMLTLARQESASAGFGPLPASDIAECMRQTAAQLATVATLRGIEVTMAAPGVCSVPIAADDCSLLLSNLLLNALQHSPQGAQIELRLCAENDSAHVEIEDHGEGIDPEALPHVFERFYRGDPSRTRSTGGTGLGLAICKAIVERAGGSIGIVSQPGQGTTVTVRLPLVPSP